MYTKFLILLAILVVNCDFISSETVTKSTKFDDYLVILQNTSNFKNRLRLTEAVWGQIRADYPDDLNKTRSLYYTMYYDNTPAKGRQAANELMEEIRYYLAVKNAHILAKIMNGIDIANTLEIVEYLKSLTSYYIASLVKDIYCRAIDHMYNVKEPQQLAWFLRQTTQEDQLNSFAYKNMIEAQLYLYWKFHNGREVNDLYFFDVGYYFSEIKRDYFYGQLDNSLKKRLNEAIESLPSSLQYFYFETNFCLLNKAYNEFIYTTNGIIDDDRVHIFTYPDQTQLIGQCAWKQNLTEINTTSGSLNLEISLESYDKEMFLYLEQNLEDYMHLLAGWRSGKAPVGSTWSVRLLDNSLVFTQNEFVMCASDKLYTTLKRYVYGYEENQEHNARIDACQWIARTCQ